MVTCNVDRDVSTAYCWSSSGDKVDVTYKSRCSAMIGWFSTAVIGAFRFSLFVWIQSFSRCSAVAPLSCCCVSWSWTCALVEFLFTYPCWCCQLWVGWPILSHDHVTDYVVISDEFLPGLNNDLRLKIIVYIWLGLWKPCQYFAPNHPYALWFLDS